MYVVDACIHTLAYVDVYLYLQDMAFYFKAFFPWNLPSAS